ncbi:DUF5110 domain-containing protein [Bacteroides caecigallinarum]|nr:DUF5110 domain-containing protein [Bacteroides caecigallinarum]
MRNVCFLYFILLSTFVCGNINATVSDNNELCFWRGHDSIIVMPLADNAVRIVKKVGEVYELPEMVYVEGKSVRFKSVKRNGKDIIILKKLVIEVSENTITFLSPDGRLLLKEKEHNISPSQIQNGRTYISMQGFHSPEDEHLYGLGQFQDNNLDVRGLTRRLTQVNTQISIPFIMSNKGYGLLWNNYGLTDFNPCDDYEDMKPKAGEGHATTVNVTSTTGGVTEVRHSNIFTAELDIKESGRYSLMLDVGSRMARKHNLVIDGSTVIDMNNLWLPPTTSVIVELSEGRHKLVSELTKEDSPKVYYRKVDNTTVFSSPVSNGIDYTFFAGTPDEVITSYREVTGGIPMMPLWALGYIHCRERFHSQSELLDVANRFRKESLPVDMIVQDWQYWGKYGWNAMRFDEEYYPDPAALTDSLHAMDMKFMLSIWSKIDPASALGKKFGEKGYYIDNTQWVDFFNPEAAAFYWNNMRDSLVNRYDIDALWLDATEPENDDLRDRRVCGGRYPGEVFRNAYPLVVNKTVYEGIRRDSGNKRAMLFTRCAFPGMQRYGVATWSGDVGNDWETFRRQIVAGLGISVAGLPWWTYDAGGFFRPQQQYTDDSYRQRFVRWLQTSVFLPLMRVHGYMTDTEFWNYGDEVVRLSRKSLSLRYSLMPYIYSSAADVSFNGSTIMRPLVMDFPEDQTALSLKYQYMFGHSLMVAPVVEPDIKSMKVYLPHSKGGWYDFNSGRYVSDGGWHNAAVTIEEIPVYVRAGSIIPLTPGLENTSSLASSNLEVRIYKGTDGEFRLYEDEGDNYNYENDKYGEINMKWDDSAKELILENRRGSFEGMCNSRNIKAVMISSDGVVERNLHYDGKKTVVNFNL